jgi:hypothetical protein
VDAQALHATGIGIKNLELEKSGAGDQLTARWHASGKIGD